MVCAGMGVHGTGVLVRVLVLYAANVHKHIVTKCPAGLLACSFIVVCLQLVNASRNTPRGTCCQPG
jgi:hypothetical protein